MMRERRMMKAYVLNGVGQLDYMDVPIPKLKADEVLIEVKAAGICGSDIPRIFETGTYHFPTIPGHEFAGVVREVADEEYVALVGKRVGVFPLIPCMKCGPCEEQKYEMCMHYDYLGSRSDGGFAEYVAVPARNVIELPDEISFGAAAMLEPASVGVHALRRINLDNVKSAAVFGPGTIGLLMAQWLRALGTEDIYIVGTNLNQRNLASKLGYKSFYNSSEEDVQQLILDATHGAGTDLAIDCVGVSGVLEQCLNVAKRGGEIITVGNPHGDVVLQKDIYWKLLRKQLRISGTWNSSFIPDSENDDWRMTVNAMLKKSLKPEEQITHCLPFDKLHCGLEIMRDKKEYFNKVMIVR